MNYRRTICTIARDYFHIRCVALGFLIAIATIWHPISASSQQQQEFNFERALRNLNAVRSGQLMFDQLGTHEQGEVRVLAQMMSRPKAPTDASDGCRDAWETAASRAGELADYAGRLKKCAEADDFQNDCSNEYRHVKNAQNEYADASQKVLSECY